MAKNDRISLIPILKGRGLFYLQNVSTKKNFVQFLSANNMGWVKNISEGFKFHRYQVWTTYCKHSIFSIIEQNYL